MPVLPELLVSQFDYTRHASMLVLDAARRLTPEELTRDLKVSHTSVLGTLAHIFQADRVWLMRFRGTSPASLAKPGGELTLADLEALWAPLLDEFREYAGSLDESGAAETLTFRNLAGKEFTMPRWQVLMHVVNHGTLHRGQVMAMLRQLGHVPPPTDLIYYYRS